MIARIPMQFYIGCGSGQFLLLLSKFTKAMKLGGIEISSTLINNAKDLLILKVTLNFRLKFMMALISLILFPNLIQ